MAAFDTSLQSRLTGTLCALLLALSCNVTAQPDRDWWGCQYIESGGLIWEDMTWNATLFKLREPFVLMADGTELLDINSVAKPLQAEAAAVTCVNENSRKHIFCQSRWTGATLSFDPETGTGAVSKILGAFEGLGDSRDTLSIEVFKCSKG